MTRRKVRKPSPAVVIALVALFAALGGTAVGGIATSALTKKEFKQVKRIAKSKANQQIKKKAPKLSVAHADAADNADNSTALEGSPASAFEPAVDWVLVNAAGEIVQQSGGITVDKPAIAGAFFVVFPDSLVGRPLSGTLQGTDLSNGTINAVPCGGGVDDDNATVCLANNTNNVAQVATYSNGALTDRPFFLIAHDG